MSIGDSLDLPASEPVYLELSDGQSHKFYEVTVNGTVVAIRYGRIGTAGQSSNSTYAIPEEAQAEAIKKINEKLSKGYVRVPLGGDRPTSSEQLLTDPSPELSSIENLGMQAEGQQVGTQEQPLDSRHYWVYDSGWFTSDGQGGWEEVNEETRRRGQPWRFRETTRPEEYVEMYDQSRWVTVRLTATAMLVRWDRDGNAARWEEYHKGQWQECPADRPAAESPEASKIRMRSTDLVKSPFDRSQESTHPPTAAPPLPAIAPTIPAPSGKLLHKAVRGPTFLPRVTQTHLPAVRYPLGFVFDGRRFYDLIIPLARSLVCFEMVGTIVNLDAGGFTLQVAANQDTYYNCDFRPQEGQIIHGLRVRGESSPPEHASIPSTIASGQIFHYVLTITESTIVAYLNNYPVFHTLQRQPFNPLDTLHLNYDPSGLRLQLARVLEPATAESQTPHPNNAIATPVPSSPQATATQEAIADSPLLQNLPSQFEPLRPYIEAKLQSYIKIQVGEEVRWLDSPWIRDPLDPWQSKIGGFPYLPKGTDYPTDRETGELMLFLMQINCADLPIIDGLNLPRQGILQFYSGLDVPLCEVSPEQHRILYFPEVSQDRNDLITDFGFLVEYAEIEEWYDEIYPLTFATQQDLFRVTREGYLDTLEVPEELETLSEEFMEWLDEQNSETIAQRINKIGGEVESHSYVSETVGEAQGLLLLELNHPCDCDDHFYFFIEASDLANLDFSNVESYFMRV